MPFNLLEDEADEFFETDEADEMDEAVGRKGWARPKTASGQSTFKARPQSQFVTQAQLETALAKVGAQVKTNSTAIGTLNGRVNVTVEAVKKETTDRKKEVAGVRSGLSQTQQMSAILPLLSQPSSVMDTDKNSSLSGQKVLVDSSNSLSLLLPMLLLTGIGNGDSSSNTSGGLFGGGDNSSMMMLAMVLALGNK